MEISNIKSLSAAWFQKSTIRPHSQGTRNAMRRTMQRKQMGPVVVNGSVHTAGKQHQRICVPICMRVASGVLCELGLTLIDQKSRFQILHETPKSRVFFWDSQYLRQKFLSSYLGRFCFCYLGISSTVGVLLFFSKCLTCGEKRVLKRNIDRGRNLVKELPVKYSHKQVTMKSKTVPTYERNFMRKTERKHVNTW